MLSIQAETVKIMISGNDGDPRRIDDPSEASEGLGPRPDWVVRKVTGDDQQVGFTLTDENIESLRGERINGPP